jgi:FAD/FMN-containing dehydrogenase
VSPGFPDDFAGEVVRPDDEGYDGARAVWNGMVDRRPALIVRPTSADDVALAVRYGREQALPIAVRGGGHSIPGLSTCDDGIVIDLSGMRGVTADPHSRTARANGGALLAELDDAAQAHGLVCPVGVVSHTGVAGLTLGGGMGRLQRKFGLTIDNLLSVDLVTADGKLVRAAEDENPELFWGMRGAGANFGVVTSFEFRLHPLDHPVTHGAVIHPIDRASDLAEHYRSLAEASPDELWLSYTMGLLDGQPVAIVSVLHCGSVDEAERDLRGLRSFGPPLVDSIEVKKHLDAQHANDEGSAWGHRFYMKSAYLPALPDELIRLCTEHAKRVPEGAEPDISIWAWGRAIAEVPEDGTAFTGREAAFWFAAEIMWDDPALDDACREWSRAIVDDVTPFAISGRYVNDVAETDAGLGRSIYGEAKYDRLVALKRAWDPDNVFRLNQNIRP